MGILPSINTDAVKLAHRAVNALERLADAVHAHTSSAPRCEVCDVEGRLRCPVHGPDGFGNGTSERGITVSVTQARAISAHREHCVANSCCLDVLMVSGHE